MNANQRPMVADVSPFEVADVPTCTIIRSLLNGVKVYLEWFP